MKLLSIVVPCYNEEGSIPLFYAEVAKIAVEMSNDFDIEIIFVDDGSSDQTLQVIKEYQTKDSRVKYISFSRNFGKEAAMYAGMQKSKGDLVVIMDADLQHPPSMLMLMHEEIIINGYDCAATRRSRKGDPAFRSFWAQCFYRVINLISKTKIIDGSGDYRMMTRQMVNSLLQMQEYNRFSKGLFSWVGYKTKWLFHENIGRATGVSKWSFWGLFLYSLEGIISFSTVPLALASFLGLVLCIISIIYGCVMVVDTLLWGSPVPGNPSIICLVAFIGGIQLFCTGILGQYIAKIYLEAKRRPIFLVKDEL